MPAADAFYMPAQESALYYDEPAGMNWNTEEYGTVQESGFQLTSQNPLSTFGMDVDTASYTLLRRNALNDTMSWMPRDGVRIEEMINYFSYDYPEPEEDLFQITAEISDCPWNQETRLMLIGLNARDIPEEEIPDQNLVLLIDTSGSMYDQDKLPLAVSSLEYLIPSLGPEDTISIVTYAGSSEVALKGESCTEEGKERICEVLESLEAGGGTYGEGGIRKAYELARETFLEGGNNRVLLFTDGDFNLGQTDDTELVDLVKKSAGEEIFLSIFGLGEGNYNDALAERLADEGNGNYSYIDSSIEARRTLGGAMKGTLNTVAKDAKIQVDFNPAVVKGYRLIGYENRAMDDADFMDDSKDGGEVGAGQQVTVLYELVMTGSSMEIPSAHSRYTETESLTEAELSGGEEYLTVSIRYQNPDAEENAGGSILQELPVTSAMEREEMSDNMTWAAGVAETGMLLRGSEYAGDSSYEDVRESLKGLTSDEYREEFVYLLKYFEAAGTLGDS
jgi:Ca-activated chloride channel family protein